MANEPIRNEHQESLDLYDAKWAGDLGITITRRAPVDEDCTPACTEDFHVC